MFLKAIELENFKSFKGEVLIPYELGFTAITGPNGSGKSNCGDAIQFVLGPRSAKSLRAQNVKDLIFNGGKKDKPARSCTATLVFDNAADASGQRRLRVDADEVRFTRTVKLNRKNDSVTAYYLNERSSTSTEFRRILTEAGARGDGYNIVLQGDVTHLATMTSRDRRKVLDDVAGVTAYDDEIKRADRQRKKAEEYLERITLLEDELKDRLKTLSKEREQAMKYRNLAEALDNARITAIHARHRSRLNDIQMIADERTGYLTRIEELSTSIQDTGSELLDLDVEIAEIERQLDSVLGDDGKALGERLRKLQVDVETRKDRISDSETAIEEAQDEIQVLSKEQSSGQEALDEHQIDLTKAQEALVKADADMESAAAEETAAREAISGGDRATHDLNRAFGKATEAVTKADESRVTASLEADRALNQVTMAEERLAELEESLADARLTRDDLQLVGEDLQIADGENDRSQLAEELTRLQRQERTLMEQTEDIERQVREAERSLARAQGEMENRSGSKAGLAQAVSAIMTLKDSGEVPGILGPLGQLCAPKNAEHEEALAFALGGGMNSIIVRDDETAATCIKWLRDNRAGRATFLPLNKLTVRRPGGKAVMTARQDGVIGFASALLEYDESIESAVKHAVRDTLIVRDMGTARRHMGGVRMVTLDGSITEASGAMVGGAVRGRRPQFGGNIAGMNAVQQAETELSRLEILSETVNAALAESRQTQHRLRERINNLGGDDSSLKLRAWQEDMKRANTAFESAEDKVKVCNAQLVEVKNVHRKSQERADASTEAYDTAVTARQSASESLLSSSPEHLSERLRASDELRIAAMQAKIDAESKLATGNANTELLQHNVNEITRRISEQSSIVEKAQSRIDELNSEIETLNTELATVSDAHEQVAEEHRELNERSKSLREDRAGIKASLETNSAKRESLRNRCGELSQEIENKNRLLEELTQEMATQNVKPVSEDIDLPSVGDAESSVRNIERRIGNLGDVNMKAIEQYDEAEERLVRITDDSSVLRKRRTDLIELTGKLEGERKSRLTTVLEIVSENFKRVYSRLSDGGNAELRLENPKDPFTGGLEMWCQPRGKSSKSKLSLLSGGEKSMAALALIFAIQDYEPSPFYYFDEVDQNLDAYNAEHIARLCRLRSQRAQFIMVTLRKVSLQLADHHIGITHAGDGCSRRITDFDREQAIELGDAAHAELEAAEATLEKKAKLTKNLPDPSKMESVPEELPTPASLGGSLLDAEDSESEAQVEPTEEGPEIVENEGPDVTIVSLADRAADEKEDMDEKLEWERAVDAKTAEVEAETESVEDVVTAPEVEEQE
ncbi:MAG: chromosome segregation protein SMC [Candidatus Thalassarchaeaceae archaeon]|nr:chromosome segregation protein SMC [Candidatus Thalassarchaeaceae archaeon]